MAKTMIFNLTVVGDPARAKATAEHALVERRFKVTWSDDWNAVAERGNKLANAVAGAMAQYMKVMVSLHGGPESGQTVIRLEKASSGAMGGAIGVSRTTKNFTTLQHQLAETFKDAGVLVGVTQA